ncbi:MAG: hypothetical protein MUO43_06800 [Desulfobacterales bacterium]|nr:hypothetical protein [Desulfobacterales bacterium]
MVKSLGILIGGIFVGAVSAEIIRKNYPKSMNNVYTKACEITSGVKEAFKKGYVNAIQSQQAAEPSV